LIVDDEPHSRRLLEVMLAAEGYVLATTATGEEALSKVTLEPPDLILLDLMLPGIDGCQVAASLKGSSATRNIPIIMITALDSREERVRGLKAGAEDFLSRPLDRAELCARVRNLLALKAYGHHYDLYSQRLEGEAASHTAALIERTKALEQQVVLCIEQTTALEERSRDLADALQLAEQAGRAKENLLGRVSHELRTPLNAILGWSEMLGADPNPALLQRGIPAIRRNALAQERVIASLLDVSSIDAGSLRIDTRPADLRLVVRNAIDIVRPAADAKQLSIVSAGDGPAVVLGDPARLRQVLWHLLSNAVKFTPDGGAIRVHLQAAGGKVRLEVSDDGIGIPPEFLPHAFSGFTQADMSTTRKHPGLGLGLTLVRKLIEMQGGTVTALSPGTDQGATFVVELPRYDARAGEFGGADIIAEPTVSAGADLTGVRVLVVDDDPESREIVSTILEAAGAWTAVADSGATGLQCLLDLDMDVVVSDIAMPDHDGFAFINDVRTLPGEDKRRVPVVALTALASRQERESILVAGFQAHVAKPVLAATLLESVASVCGRAGQPAA
jgi:signal transduction histidine kinase